MEKTTKEDRLKALMEKVEQGIKEVFKSENYRNYLTVMSKFHNYSFRNCMLIMLQKPEATYVAGYEAWQNDFKRHVNKGEKGIQIIAYAPKKMEIEKEKKDPNGKTLIGQDGQPIMEKITKEIPSFMPTSVFDVSQTNGEPLPTLVNELNGRVDRYKDFMEAISKVSKYSISFEDIPGGVNGYCDMENKKIVIKQGMSEAQTIKTMIHELAHEVLHAPDVNQTSKEKSTRSTREVEAESTAFVVCEHYGIDTSEYSFPYLASWSSSNELKELQMSMNNIQKQAGSLIKQLDKQLEQIQQRNKEKQSTVFPTSEHDNVFLSAFPEGRGDISYNVSDKLSENVLKVIKGGEEIFRIDGNQYNINFKSVPIEELPKMAAKIFKQQTAQPKEWSLEAGKVIDGWHYQAETNKLIRLKGQVTQVDDRTITLLREGAETIYPKTELYSQEQGSVIAKALKDHLPSWCMKTICNPKLDAWHMGAYQFGMKFGLSKDFITQTIKEEGGAAEKQRKLTEAIQQKRAVIVRDLNRAGYQANNEIIRHVEVINLHTGKEHPIEDIARAYRMRAYEKTHPEVQREVDALADKFKYQEMQMQVPEP
jgi:antirestriction protein ArdC